MSDNAAFLKNIPLFANLSPEDLIQLCAAVEEVHLGAGETLFTEGSLGDRAYVIKTGRVEIVKRAHEREVLLAVRESGVVIGEMAVLIEAPRTATVRALIESSFLAISRERLEHLLQTSASAALAMLQTILTRWQNTASLMQQSEKMAQLGTLTAGVAHELNNPASAVRRGADHLSGALRRFEAATRSLETFDRAEQHSAAQQQALADLEARGFTGREIAAARALDALARSDLEYEIETWLDGLGVPEAWELAPELVEMGMALDELEELRACFAPTDDAARLTALFKWLAAAGQVYSLLTEISSGAERIAEIVQALKSYAYLDQAPIQSVDIQAGLENTLIIMRGKLKDGITVQRTFAPDLPTIQAYGGELNQVWTNLIDNAAGAMEDNPPEKPRILTLRTAHSGGWVTVDIEDTGSGISPEIIGKIFDPFFTTKPPGKGTGLGLNISYNIITEKHRGEIKVFSGPGGTLFRVYLPVDLDAALRGAGPPLILSRPADAQLKEILETTRTIVVVGMSTSPEKAAHTVPAYLLAHGYRVIPVNPGAEEILGQRSYPTLTGIARRSDGLPAEDGTPPVDLVLIFRPSEFALEIVEEAIQIGAKVVWMQEEIVNEHAAQAARSAGLAVVMDTCIRATHKRLYGYEQNEL